MEKRPSFTIRKRNGCAEPFLGEKIALALEKCFRAAGTGPKPGDAAGIVSAVRAQLEAHEEMREVERIQDLVERQLMQRGYFDEAKRYILYREQRSGERRLVKELSELTGGSPSEPVWKGIARDFPQPLYSLEVLRRKAAGMEKEGGGSRTRLGAFIAAAEELTTAEAPLWEMIAARLLNFELRSGVREAEQRAGVTDFYSKISWLVSEGLYGGYILEHYSREEIARAAAFIDDGRDRLFSYPALSLLSKRYLIRPHDGSQPVETPQEMFLGIALHLAMKEKKDRLGWVKRFYSMMSRLQVTMATPTLANARKPAHQLSSCFIDTVPDSLEGIYRCVSNFAQVSKWGGGMGLYFGKVRAAGGRIRGFDGAAGGIVRWLKLVNDTAVAVDQLGVRQGAAAVYLDVWHRDLPEFLQIRTNNGDDRMKAHDIFPAVCFPDLFWRRAKEDLGQPWAMFCPDEVWRTKGWHLEDFYGEEWERRYLECVADRRISRRVMTIRDIVRLIIKSAVETGTPFIFNRDTVNRANPNPHKGMIYCSNLCTEIAQNMSAIGEAKTEVRTVDGETVVTSSVTPGDFVVCNLASLVLGRIPLEDPAALKEIVAAAVRALDNVIDLNRYPLPYAEITSRRYRGIGLGVSGWHHALAVRGIPWESDRHLQFADEVFEWIAQAAIEASSDLAAERGSYAEFPGSDWQSGAYFDKRGYVSEAWQALREKVRSQGMRNGWLMAVAPTSSTGIIAGTTSGVDPVMKRFFLEEKKGSMLPRVAPGLSNRTWWMYKSAYLIDQKWSIRAAGIRQRHVDQAQSVNLYITNEFTMRQVLALYIQAWEEGVKTLYYVRSKSLEVEECESCAS